MYRERQEWGGRGNMEEKKSYRWYDVLSPGRGNGNGGLGAREGKRGRLIPHIIPFSICILSTAYIYILKN